MRVLVVEDDVVLCNTLRLRLEEEGFAADMAHDGDQASFLGEQGVFDAVVLDLGLPARSGLQVLRGWRKQGLAMPVIILSARNGWQEKIEGIEAGADDYLGKPFQVPELVARIKALIRRAQAGNQGPVSRDGFLLDEVGQDLVAPDGARIGLTGTEFRIFRPLFLNPGRILSKEAIMNHIYDFDAIHDANVIEVHVNHLRRKLGREAIVTLRGQGYRLGRLGAG